MKYLHINQFLNKNLDVLTDPYADMIMADGISLLCSDLQVSPPKINYFNHMSLNQLIPCNLIKYIVYMLVLGSIYKETQNYFDVTVLWVLYVHLKI